MSKSRTFSICLTDLPKKKMIKHANGKIYINLSSWDNDEKDEYGNDFGITIPWTKEEAASKKAGNEVSRLYVGNGKIWEQQTVQENEDPLGLETFEAETVQPETKTKTKSKAKSKTETPKNETEEDHFI